MCAKYIIAKVMVLIGATATGVGCCCVYRYLDRGGHVSLYDALAATLCMVIVRSGWQLIRENWKEQA
jgi:hypothetical protein